MMEIWGGPGLDHGPGFLPAAQENNATWGTQGTPVQGVAQASAKGVPFICKPPAGRRLAAHMAGTYRVAVAGGSGADGKKTLSNMDASDYIKGLVLIDGSMDNSNPIEDGKRRLGAHAKTIMMMKTWTNSTEGLKGQNPCFDFELPSAWGITYLKAAAQRENGGKSGGGLWFSDNVKLDEIPDCPEGMHAAAGRRLAAHAGKCAKIEMPKSCLPDGDHDKKASSGSLTTAATSAAVLAATTLMASIFA